MTEREVLLGDLARVERRLKALEMACEELIAWKVEQSKPIIVTIDPAAFDDSPRRRQEQARALVSKALDK